QCFFKSFIHIRRFQIAVARFHAPVDTMFIHLNANTNAPVHGRSQRLRATHTTEAGRDQQLALQRAVKLLAGTLRKSLIGALQNTLCADVNPRAGGHLSVHSEAHLVEAAEFIPIRPFWHQVRVGNEHTRGFFMRSEHAHGLAALYQHGLIIFQAFECRHNLMVAFPVPRSLPAAAIDDQLFRLFGYLRIQIIHQHTQSRFLMPALTLQLRSSWRLYILNNRICTHNTHSLNSYLSSLQSYTQDITALRKQIHRFYKGHYLKNVKKNRLYYILTLNLM